MTTITLSGEPKSTQHIYKYAYGSGRPRMYMTSDGKGIKEGYYWEAKSQWEGPPLRGDIALSVTFFFKDKRKRDLDNQNKLLLDSSTGIVYRDDSQIADLRLRRKYDPKNPRIEVTAVPLQQP